METTTLPHCGQPALSGQAVLKQSQLLISLGAPEMAPSVGMQISYYCSDVGPLPYDDASSNSHWSSPLQAEVPPNTPVFWLQRLFWIILNDSGQNKNISEILHNCHHLPCKGPFHKTFSIYLHVWNKRASSFLGWPLCMPHDQSHWI